jgi:ABC-type sugar transport system ATPase subunit
VRQPQVFLFDEPLSNLDAKLRVQTRKEIARLHRQLAATMIYVTHDQVEAMTMGDRIVVMNAGHIQQIGKPLELYDRPANRFVAGFIGSPAMNFMRGSCARTAAGCMRRLLSGHFDVPLSSSAAARAAPRSRATWRAPAARAAPRARPRLARHPLYGTYPARCSTPTGARCSSRRRG